jgi:hypothetical protein
VAVVEAQMRSQSGRAAVPGHFGLLPSRRGNNQRAIDSTSTMHAARMKAGDTAVVADDTVASGETIKAAIQAIVRTASRLDLNFELALPFPLDTRPLPTSEGRLRIRSLGGADGLFTRIGPAVYPRDD